MSEPTLEPVKKSSSRKITINKGAKKEGTKKSPVKAKAPTKVATVKKKTENGVIEVPAVEYNRNLSHQFDEAMRDADSFKEFKKDIKGPNREYLPAYKEHARRQRKLVNDGKTLLDHVETWLTRAVVAGAVIVAGKAGVDSFREYRERKALEV
jgi:hypothetical protein